MRCALKSTCSLRCKSNGFLIIRSDSFPSDFMVSEGSINPDDYFSRMHSIQESPEFTVRNINALLTHETPIFQNAYEVIRAREIFDRVESYKTFLDEIRL